MHSLGTTWLVRLGRDRKRLVNKLWLLCRHKVPRKRELLPCQWFRAMTLLVSWKQSEKIGEPSRRPAPQGPPCMLAKVSSPRSLTSWGRDSMAVRRWRLPGMGGAPPWHSTGLLRVYLGPPLFWVSSFQGQFHDVRTSARWILTKHAQFSACHNLPFDRRSWKATSSIVPTSSSLNACGNLWAHGLLVACLTPRASLSKQLLGTS